MAFIGAALVGGSAGVSSAPETLKAQEPSLRPLHGTDLFSNPKRHFTPQCKNKETTIQKVMLPRNKRTTGKSLQNIYGDHTEDRNPLAISGLTSPPPNGFLVPGGDRVRPKVQGYFPVKEQLCLLLHRGTLPSRGGIYVLRRYSILEDLILFRWVDGGYYKPRGHDWEALYWCFCVLTNQGEAPQ
jgi:hypothetical protein